jgi:hypothetical protein
MKRTTTLLNQLNVANNRMLQPYRMRMLIMQQQLSSSTPYQAAVVLLHSAAQRRAVCYEVMSKSELYESSTSSTPARKSKLQVCPQFNGSTHATATRCLSSGQWHHKHVACLSVGSFSSTCLACTESHPQTRPLSLFQYQAPSSAKPPSTWQQHKQASAASSAAATG